MNITKNILIFLLGTMFACGVAATASNSRQKKESPITYTFQNPFNHNHMRICYVFPRNVYENNPETVTCFDNKENKNAGNEPNRAN